ncbi:MAG: hypothetical protein AAGJ08_10590 [Cyanobacteria bacterium P01_H01_bin.35]
MRINERAIALVVWPNIWYFYDSVGTLHATSLTTSSSVGDMGRRRCGIKG